MPQPPEEFRREFDAEKFRQLQEVQQRLRPRLKPQSISDEPDEKGGEEREDLDAQRKRIENQGLGQDIEERKRYALAFFILGCSWVTIIFLILMLQGFGSFWWGLMPFRLSENVLLAAIGSTTVNVLGILYVVANYLFPKK